MTTISKKGEHINDCWNTIGVWSLAKEKCMQLEEYIHCRNCPVFSNSGRSVFENKPPVGYLSQWRKEIAGEINKTELKSNSVLVFRSGSEWFAFPASILSEISNEKNIHRIPRNLNKFILGIVNINGEIKVCYSLNDFLGIKAGDDREDDTHIPKRLIVIRLNENDYVFPVDEVKGLDWYGDSDLRPVPSTLESSGADILLGSLKKPDYNVAVFDIDRFQERLEGTAP